ncbi:16194_t:CDS:2 [Acaulospora morrowiae]|uniref:16194_t:CDS:1 n=1 Tax=Acaulospora morrowiae TaxID=94023 RepID=A0A9N9I848_9GLOM|nr:16194_t:CDS:2 [Acaulospora morrowiae]
MPPQVPKTEYPVIDTDPHFKRVVRYFRPSDYLSWAAITGFGPAFYLFLEKTANQPPTKRLGLVLKICAGLSFTGGFMFAYQRSSCEYIPPIFKVKVRKSNVLDNSFVYTTVVRFWGWTENAREYEKDLKEMRQRVKEGKPLYGESSLDDHIQHYASTFSKYAALNFASFPVFNFVNHNRHGTDTSRYYEGTAEKDAVETTS